MLPDESLPGLTEEVARRLIHVHEVARFRIGNDDGLRRCLYERPVARLTLAQALLGRSLLRPVVHDGLRGRLPIIFNRHGVGLDDPLFAITPRNCVLPGLGCLTPIDTAQAHTELGPPFTGLLKVEDRLPDNITGICASQHLSACRINVHDLTIDHDENRIPISFDEAAPPCPVLAKLISTATLIGDIADSTYDKTRSVDLNGTQADIGREGRSVFAASLEVVALPHPPMPRPAVKVFHVLLVGGARGLGHQPA